MNEIEQKEIEEMAKVIRDADALDCLNDNCDNCNYQYHHYCDSVMQATSVYNAGYRNCKDKVVLDKEELDKINELNAKNIKREQEATARDIFNALGFITYRKQGKAYIFDVKELRELAKQYGVEVE